MSSDPNNDLDKIDAQIRRANTTVRIANIIFYILVTTCFIIGEIYKNVVIKSGYSTPWHSVWYLTDVVLMIMSASLLVFSILRFKGLIKSMESEDDFFAGERLMTVHLIIFTICVVAYIGEAVLEPIYLKNYDAWY